MWREMTFLPRMFFAAIALLACTQAGAAACNQGQVRGTVPQVIELCTPGIERRLDAIEKRLVADEEMRQRFEAEIKTLLLTLDKAARLSGNRQAEMAASLEKLLVDPQRFESAAGLREIRRLNDQGEEFVEKAADQPVSQEIGNAVAALDLNLANQLLVGIETIQKQVSTVQMTLDRGNAFETLMTVAERKPKGEVGQSAALQVIFSNGGTFVGMDLSGLTFQSAQLDGADLTDATLKMAGFPGSRLREAKFHNADVTATNLMQADLSRADMTQSLGAFARAAGASFEGADLRKSSWVAADLQNTNFRNADLRGVNFGLADLRGADLRGAKLKDSFFGGADLRDVKFDGAEIMNMDVTATVLHTASLSAAQRSGLCMGKSRESHGWVVRFIAMEDLTKPISTQMEDILEYKDAFIFWPTALLGRFQSCSEVPSESSPRKPLKYGINELSDQFRIDVTGALMDNGNRRNDLVALILERLSSAASRIEAVKAIAEVPARP